MSLRSDIQEKRQSIIYNALLAVGGGTNSMLEVDFGEILDIIEQFQITARTLTDDDTAPGSSKTILLDIYWSDEKIATPANAVTECAARKTAGAAKTLTNATSTAQEWELVSSMVPLARYAYIALTWTAFAANSDENRLTLRLRRTL